MTRCSIKIILSSGKIAFLTQEWHFFKKWVNITYTYSDNFGYTPFLTDAIPLLCALNHSDSGYWMAKKKNGVPGFI